MSIFIGKSFSALEALSSSLNITTEQEDALTVINRSVDRAAARPSRLRLVGEDCAAAIMLGVHRGGYDRTLSFGVAMRSRRSHGRGHRLALLHFFSAGGAFHRRGAAGKEGGDRGEKHTLGSHIDVLAMT